MAGAREIIRRAGEKRGGSYEFGESATGLRPVCPAPAVTENGADTPGQTSQRVVVAQPIRENSVYRQLMRSHDRMSTRHLKG